MARELLWLVPRQLTPDLLVKLQLPKAIDVLLREKLVSEGQGHVLFQGFSAFPLQPSYRLGNLFLQCQVLIVDLFPFSPGGLISYLTRISLRESLEGS